MLQNLQHVSLINKDTDSVSKLIKLFDYSLNINFYFKGTYLKN